MNSLSTCENKTVLHLEDIRNGVLLRLQDPRQSHDLKPMLEKLALLQEWAAESSIHSAAALCSECTCILQEVQGGLCTSPDEQLRDILDRLVRIEAELMDHEIGDDLFGDVADFVDTSFDNLVRKAPPVPEPAASEEFEIDEETREIFRCEAADLMAIVSSNLETLGTNPDDREALWEMRRAVHTLKGAAGIVGMDEAANLSHRIEDLLGVLVEQEFRPDASVLAALNSSAEYLTGITAGQSAAGDINNVTRMIDVAMAETASKCTADRRPADGNVAKVAPDDNPDVAKPAPTRIVRIAMDRLHELQSLARKLAVTRTKAAEIFDNIAPALRSPDVKELETLLATQMRLCRALVDKLDEIRMVRFGTLATRLTRTVNVTCQEEGKKAEVVIENEDVELDTQIIDALIEPLLHLLRNAVVHGIETPELRRMIAKPERGLISVRVENNDQSVTVSVSDNGRGINAVKLKEKALAVGSITHQLAESMTDDEAMELMFLRGVTTAETLNMNAGRGIGMSIVKESVESRGGKLSIVTQPQKGSTFSITFPIESEIPVGPTIETVHVPETKRPSGTETSEIPFSEVPTPVALQTDTQEPQPQTPAKPTPAAQHENVTEPDLSPTNSRLLSVLIVDDSMTMRQTITRVIERAGWTAMSACDGLQGLDMLRNPLNRPDVIITDLEMPRHNGFALLKDLKRNLDLREIPVIMLTSRSERIQREKALSLGAARFLTKPLESSELRSAITELCRSNVEADG